MDKFASKLNNLMVDTFRNVLKIEEYSLRKTGEVNLSISELHLIEAVAKNNENGKTISQIAQELSITLSSVTVAINKLQKKGYVEKIRNVLDKREVHVKLTKKGHRMEIAHKYFHEQMARSVSEGFSEEEKTLLLKCINRLNDFFKMKLSDMEA